MARLDFNPLTDSLTTSDGKEVMLETPTGEVFPPKGFVSVQSEAGSEPGWGTRNAL